MSVISDVLGYSAAATTCATLVPQIHKVWVSRRCADVSYAMIAMNFASDVLWTAYGSLNGRTPLIVTGVITALTAVCLAGLKYGTETVSGAETAGGAETADAV